MSFIKTTVLAGMIGMTASAAFAADLPSKWFSPVAPKLVDKTETWYLRGDVGYSYYKRPEADYALALIEGSMADERINGNAVAGAGIGYRFSPMFRADVTLDHRFSSRFKGLPMDDSFATGSVADRARFQSSTAMVNVYADLGNHRGIMPYVGAGIGIARNVLSDYTRTITDASGDVTQIRLPGGDDYDLAWALMAGVGFKLSNSFTLDLGYRYVSLGDVKTRDYANGAGADVESIGAHEVRVGMRYALP